MAVADGVFRAGIGEDVEVAAQEQVRAVGPVIKDRRHL